MKTRLPLSLLAALLAAITGIMLVRRVLGPLGALFRALAGTVVSYRDGD